MENFENQQQRSVKEKSMYLLHLDGARIFILSAIVIGLLTVAFLVGMKLTGEQPKDDVLAQNDALLDQSITAPQGNELSDPLKNPLADSGQNNNAPQNIAQNTITNTQNNTLPDLPVDHGQQVKQPADLMAADEVHPSLPSSNEYRKPGRKIAKSTKKHERKKEKVSKKRRDDTVEVSSENSPKSVKGLGHSGYMLQVASYDRLDTAKKEVSNLKAMDYDAIVDKTQVKGKSFFRVRIGPISSKDKALQMLEEIQNESRYAESFVTKE